MEQKLSAQIKQLQQAVTRFREVLSLPLDVHGTVRDSAIQRFEFCTDLSWKTIKTFLLTEHGIESASPKSSLRETFGVGLVLNDDSFWLTMLEMRNLTVHTYNEDVAQEIYTKLPETLIRFETLLTSLTK